MMKFNYDEFDIDECIKRIKWEIWDTHRYSSSSPARTCRIYNLFMREEIL